MQGNILVTLSLGILITSVVAVELRNLRSTTFFYLFHSILLFSIITAYAYLSKNTSLYLWSATCFLTKIILIPTLLFQFARRFPTREYRPVLGHGISVLAIGVLVVV
ncbi:MAG: hypothetical protein ONB07_04225, partial [candidate division KSB1 bacterium]|nr:hypothetical protein [candidate division KSB1 bacterium]